MSFIGEYLIVTKMELNTSEKSEEVLYMKSYKGHILILISTFGFGIVPLLAKFSLDQGMNAETILTYRFLIAGSFFVIYCLLKQIKLYTDFITSIKLVMIGLLYALESSVFFEAFNHISPSIGQLVFQVNPLMVAFGAYFLFKEKVTRNVVYALLFTATGCVLLFWEPTAHVTILGVFLVLLSALFYTIYILIGKKMLKDIPPMVVTTYTTVGCGLFLLLYSTNTGKISSITSPSIMGVIATLSIFSTIISILTFSMGLKIFGATKASIISAIEPVITVALAFVLFGERLSSIQLIGATLIVLSVIVIEMKFGREEVLSSKITDTSEITVKDIDAAK